MRGRFGQYSASAYANITTNTTTVLKTGPGVLGTIVINSVAGAGGTITVYDGVSAAAPATKIATIKSDAGFGTLPYYVPFTRGLTIVTAVAAPDITVTFN